MSSALAMEQVPQAGPQEAFHSSAADITFYGGGPGGGKSWSVTREAARHADRPGYGGIIFRRTSPQLTGPGSLWEEALNLYPSLGGVPIRSSPLGFRFPRSRALIQLHHMQFEHDKLDHQGKQYAFIAFDELTHFTETQFWYLVSRNRSTCGIRPYICATFNPDPDSWVKKMIAWYLDDQGEYVRRDRSGVVRWFYRVGDELSWGDSQEELEARHPEFVIKGKRIPPTSFTFIESSLDDNPILESVDPGYRARLMSLPKVDRERLLGRNWKIRPAAGLYFQRSYFRIIEKPPHDLEAVVRAWDKAATEATPQKPDPDWTRGVKMGRTKSGQVVVLHVESLRGSPKRVEDAIKRCADQDGCPVVLWQDPGSAGVADIAHMREVLAGHTVNVIRAAKDKVTYAGPFSTQCEGGNVALVRGPWVDAYLDELEGFPDGGHDDQVDASSGAFITLFNSSKFYADQWLSAFGGK